MEFYADHRTPQKRKLLRAMPETGENFIGFRRPDPKDRSKKLVEECERDSYEILCFEGGARHAALSSRC